MEDSAWSQHHLGQGLGEEDVVLIDYYFYIDGTEPLLGLVVFNYLILIPSLIMNSLRGGI